MAMLLFAEDRADTLWNAQRGPGSAREMNASGRGTVRLIPLRYRIVLICRTVAADRRAVLFKLPL